MKYAIIELQGKQYKVTPGMKFEVDRLEAEEGQVIALDKVLLSVGDSDTKIGTPYVEGVNLSAKVLEHTKGEKIRVATYKAKSRYRKVKGHRQYLSKIEILASALKVEKAAKPAAPAKKEAATTKKAK